MLWEFNELLMDSDILAFYSNNKLYIVEDIYMVQVMKRKTDYKDTF